MGARTHQIKEMLVPIIRCSVGPYLNAANCSATQAVLVDCEFYLGITFCKEEKVQRRQRTRLAIIIRNGCLCKIQCGSFPVLVVCLDLVLLQPDCWHFSGEPSQAATAQNAAAESRITAKKKSAAKLSISTPEMAATSNVRPNLNIGMELWSDSPVKADTSGQGEIYAAAPSQHDSALSMMVWLSYIWEIYSGNCH